MLRKTFLAAALAALAMALPSFAQEVNFKKTILDGKFRSEGVAVGDVNKDGKLDVIAGYVWYAAPDWKMHPITEKAPEYDPNGYSNSFCTFTRDLNGDDWTDVIVVDFPGTPTWWFENPQGKEGPWKKHTLLEVTNNESPAIVDLDGDGKPELICATNSDTKDADTATRYQCIARPDKDPTALWKITAISEKSAPSTTKYSHGLGFGDLNGDKRNDILNAEGWWEAPASVGEGLWKYHPAPFGQAAHMYVQDFDGDGDADVLSSSPHDFGIWWHEQLPKGEWKKHEIDKSFSQTHSLMVVDVNGDGMLDFVTGKRWWAHGPKGDNGAGDPAVMCWFEFKKDGNKPTWVKHQFDHDSGVGTQFEIADLNGDKLPDVICSNKKGVHIFVQERK